MDNPQEQKFRQGGVLVGQEVGDVSLANLKDFRCNGPVRTRFQHL